MKYLVLLLLLISSLVADEKTLHHQNNLKSSTQNIQPAPKKFTKNELVIYDVTDTTAKVKVGNLRIGQSGVIVNAISGNYTIIAQATVIKTEKDYSVIKFVKSKLLEQKAIPTLKAKPTNSDIFVLNHLYKSSLLIVPNLKSKKVIKRDFPDQNFLSEDFFASYLKVNNNPVPSKSDIIEFCSLQDIGTIFIVIKNKLFIVDALSFKIIDEIDVLINDFSTQLPFYTRVTEIETGIFDFGASSIGNYNQFYTSLISDSVKSILK